MDFDSLSQELREKALACKTPEELLELAKAEGVELNEEQYEAIAGGSGWTSCSNACGNNFSSW